MFLWIHERAGITKKEGIFDERLGSRGGWGFGECDVLKYFRGSRLQRAYQNNPGRKICPREKNDFQRSGVRKNPERWVKNLRIERTADLETSGMVSRYEPFLVLALN